MKKLILLFSLSIGFQAFAAECTSYEAQVFAKIKSVRKIEDVCFYKLEILQIKEHVFCPLSKSEIEETFVEYEAGYHDECVYRFEGEFSGILVKGRDKAIRFD